MKNIIMLKMNFKRDCGCGIKKAYVLWGLSGNWGSSMNIWRPSLCSYSPSNFKPKLSYGLTHGPCGWGLLPSSHSHDASSPHSQCQSSFNVSVCFWGWTIDIPNFLHTSITRVLRSTPYMHIYIYGPYARCALVHPDILICWPHASHAFLHKVKAFMDMNYKKAIKHWSFVWCFFLR